MPVLAFSSEIAQGYDPLCIGNLGNSTTGSLPEWLRGQTQDLLEEIRVGSNPTAVTFAGTIGLEGTLEQSTCLISLFQTTSAVEKSRYFMVLLDIRKYFRGENLDLRSFLCL